MAWLLLALALLVRAVVALRTCVPARDAEAYLWMAERAAAGDVGALFRTVFHPGYSLLTAIPLALVPGLDAVAAGQLVSCGLAALAVVPLQRIGERLGGRQAGIATALFYALGVWFVRHPADCLSEGPFFLAVASCTWLWLGASGRAGPDAARSAPASADAGAETVRGAPTARLALGGAVAGLAYGVRPEGAALLATGVAWLAIAGASRRALLAVCAAFVLAAAPWPIGWAWFGDGFTLTPKAAFNWEVGAGAAEVGARHYAQHALRVPGAMFEAIGYAALPLAALGAWRLLPLRRASPTWLLLAPFVVQCAIVPLLRSNIRFLAGYGVLLLPLAGVGAAWICARLRSRPLALALLAVLAFAGDLVRLPQQRRADRVVERDLGLHLRGTLRPGEVVATEMPRLVYFLGLPPIPPRAIPRDELLAACRDPRTRYAIVVAARSGVTAADLSALGFSPLALPPALHAAAGARGLLVFAR